MLALGEPDDDFDVGMVEGEAELLDEPAADVLPAGHLAKYRDQMAAIGLTRDEFLATYSQVIRIRPTRFLPWHGRTTPASATAATPVDRRIAAAIRRVAAGVAASAGPPAPARRPADPVSDLTWPPAVAALEPLLFLALGLIWGSTYLAVEIVGPVVGPLTLVALRLGIGAALLTVDHPLAAASACRRGARRSTSGSSARRGRPSPRTRGWRSAGSASSRPGSRRSSSFA